MHLDEKTLKHRLSVFIGSLVITLAFERVFLSIFPHINVYFNKYNVHHLYSGAFLLILVLVLFLFGTVTDWTIALAGYSSGLVLDEIVYLILTSGGDIEYFSKGSTIGAIIMSLVIIVFAMVLYHIKKTRVLSGKDIPHHLKVVISLAVLQFILDMIYVYVYPTVNPIRATMIGASALAVLLIPFMRNLTKMQPYIAFLPIYSSAFFGALLVQANVIHSKSLGSGLAHVTFLAITYFTIVILRNGKRSKNN